MSVASARSTGQGRVGIVAGIGVMAVLFMVATPARRALADEVQPSRMFGSLRLGFGYFDMSANSGQATADFSGFAIQVGLQLGGRVSQSVGVFGDFGGIFGPKPSYAENGADKSLGDYAWVSRMLSVGAVYWIRRIDILVSGGATLCKFGLRQSDTSVALAESGYGPGGFVEVARHWGRYVGLSTGVKFFYGSAVQLDRDFPWRTYSVLLTIASGYNPFRPPPPARVESASTDADVHAPAPLPVSSPVDDRRFVSHNANAPSAISGIAGNR